MRIGILGVGHIGKTLAQQLSAAGHDVKVANSRGPDTIEADVLASGGRAVWAAEAVLDVDVVILSIPLSRLRQSRRSSATCQTTRSSSTRRTIIRRETARSRTSRVAMSRACGLPNSWAGQSSRHGTRSVPTRSRRRASPREVPDRIAIPVAADDSEQRKLGMALVEETGFDAVDAGTLAESWRQQPGTPCYCTDLTREEMPGALAAADAARSPKRRDLAFAAVMERIEGVTTNPDAEYLVRLSRALFM